MSLVSSILPEFLFFTPLFIDVVPARNLRRVELPTDWLDIWVRCDAFPTFCIDCFTLLGNEGAISFLTFWKSLPSCLITPSICFELMLIFCILFFKSPSVFCTEWYILSFKAANSSNAKLASLTLLLTHIVEIIGMLCLLASGALLL